MYQQKESKCTSWGKANASAGEKQVYKLGESECTSRRKARVYKLGESMCTSRRKASVQAWEEQMYQKEDRKYKSWG